MAKLEISVRFGISLAWMRTNGSIWQTENSSLMKYLFEGSAIWLGHNVGGLFLSLPAPIIVDFQLVMAFGCPFSMFRDSLLKCSYTEKQWMYFYLLIIILQFDCKMLKYCFLAETVIFRSGRCRWRLRFNANIFSVAWQRKYFNLI